MQHMTKARCANDTPVFTLQVVTSGPMLSLCADWLAVLARQPDEIALMESFLSKAAEHHVHVPAFVIQWAIWWNSTLRGAYDWDCPALFSSMEQWVTIREPPLAPSPWFKCCLRNTCTCTRLAPMAALLLLHLLLLLCPHVYCVLL